MNFHREGRDFSFNMRNQCFMSSDFGNFTLLKCTNRTPLVSLSSNCWKCPPSSPAAEMAACKALLLVPASLFSSWTAWIIEQEGRCCTRNAHCGLSSAYNMTRTRPKVCKQLFNYWATRLIFAISITFPIHVNSLIYGLPCLMGSR